MQNMNDTSKSHVTYWLTPVSELGTCLFPLLVNTGEYIPSVR